MLHDPLADALSAIRNAEKAGKRECTVKMPSKMILEVLKKMQETGYINGFEALGAFKSAKVTVKLSGKINDCKVILPRFFVKKDGYEPWEKQFLPAAGVGVLLVSTSKGLASHRDIAGKLGGSLVAYMY